MKRVWSLLTALCLILSVFTVSASASGTASGTCGLGLEWTLTEGVLTISGTGRMTDYTSESFVPWSTYAFEIKEVVVENTVTTISPRAFYFCYKLEKVTFEADSQLFSIGAQAFYGCSGLKELHLPRSVTSVGEGAFSLCGALVLTAEEGNSVYRSEKGALLTADGKTLLRCSASGEREYTVPDGVETIAADAFSGSRTLTKLTFPESVRTLEEGAVQACSALQYVFFPEDSRLSTIGKYAFAGCGALTALEIPASVSEIGVGAFSGCSSLVVIRIPAGVRTIGAMAFANCAALRCVTVPGTVREIGDWAFAWVESAGDGAIYASPKEDFEFWCYSNTVAERHAKEEGLNCKLIRTTASLEYFDRYLTYVPGRFSDVDETAWYGSQQQGVIRAACELGIMDGMGDGSFLPTGELRLAEVIKMAAVVHARYLGSSGQFITTGSPWYADCVEYALDNGIIREGDFGDYNAAATRAQVAYIIRNTLPSTELEIINPGVSSVQDVPVEHPSFEAIVRLYRAGILLGDGDTGMFRPEDSISRAEAAAVFARLVLPELRQKLV